MMEITRANCFLSSLIRYKEHLAMFVRLGFLLRSLHHYRPARLYLPWQKRVICTSLLGQCMV